jgi:hypothetical protein
MRLTFKSSQSMNSACREGRKVTVARGVSKRGNDLHHADLVDDEDLNLSPLCIVFFAEHGPKFFSSPGHTAASKRVQRNAVDAYR